ncbi:hypothetical protein FE783_34315 [Paenibacillus mesophilus]|uniref:M14 family zinc carboxypeptidase n=1 Tax=Paenibacillus mesophilus TaxID=2582849 RepID=UPI00110EA1FE|nr:M14 family zinc carboxypeptidase [Paenibacillus mesophilus]TMV43842.1 hypothetical protein FE783_34315 [Paenibacillus mesophilus]
MSRKLFYNLRIQAAEGGVRLSFYKSTPLFLSGSENGQPPMIRIYRKEEPAFSFNEDYGEYFDGLSPEQAEILFEGAMDAGNGRKYTYVDSLAKVGSTYAYWVSSDRGDPPVGPAAVRVRDAEIWWPQQEIDRRMERLSAMYPQLVTLKSFGRSVRGADIRGLLVGNAARRAAFIGLIHPGESGPELIIPAVERLLRDNGDELAHAGLAILPAVSTDERERLVHGHPGYLRTNGSGVDINRNFPAEWEETDYSYGLDTSDPDAITYRGPRPCSEPETRAVISFIHEAKPRCVFSFHCLASICGPAFFASKYARNDQAFSERSLPLLAAYTKGFYGLEDRPVRMSYACSSGSLPAWLYKELDVPGFDLEWEGEERSRITHTDKTTRELLRDYQDRHYQGMLSVLRELRERCEFD